MGDRAEFQGSEKRSQSGGSECVSRGNVTCKGIET